MRLLLINPKCPESFWSFKWALQEILPAKRAINPPLGLATVAALCPPYWQVEIIDENIEPIPLNPQADLVGIGGMGVQFARQRELLCFYRRRGYFVVVGGSYASLCPERYVSIANAVIAGEAEHIWRRFCIDFERGEPASLYQEKGSVALENSPTPRFDLLKLGQYTSATLQFSRGCPYRCEFCDIIVMFGRRPRCKSVAQIERELDELRARGVSSVFFVDDNLIGNRPLAKQLLHALKDYQSRNGYYFRFGTEASLNLTQDPELLRLFQEANFAWVFIGIESPDEQSLKEIKKTQNLQHDLLGAVRNIYAHGIDVLAGFIVGFDNDTLDSFERQYRFIMASGIQAAMVGLLTALPRTPLYKRLRQEGRLIAEADDTDNTKLGTNIQPKRMSYEAMVAEYKTLYVRLFSDRGIAARIKSKMRYLRAPIYRGEYSFAQQVGILVKLLKRGILPGGPLRLWHFLRTLVSSKATQFPLVILDWIAGLSMRDYLERHFITDPRAKESLEQIFAALRRSILRYLDQGSVMVSLKNVMARTPNLTINLKGPVDHRFFARFARHARPLFTRTAATLTIHIQMLRHKDIQNLEHFLARITRYGDRVYIKVDEKLSHLVRIDSSVFNLMLVKVP